MFSSRLDWTVRPNPLSELLGWKRRNGEPVLDLTESNPTSAGIEYPGAEIGAALANPRALEYEPQPFGLLVAREAVAGYYRDSGLSVDASRMVLTASTSEAYAYLFKLLADPGDEILAPRPSYPLFEYLARLESVRVVQYPLLYDHGWHLDGDQLSKLVTPRTRAIVTVNPNNPTGSFLKSHELNQMLAVALEHDLAIISDEVFSDYWFARDPARVTSVAATRDVLTFALSGLSKVVGLPQMKLGWMVVSGPEDARRAAMDRLELIADTYLSVGTPVQLAAPDLLAARTTLQSQVRARLSGNLSYLRTALGGRPQVRHLDVEGGWYATLQVPRVRSEEEWALSLLREDGVLVQPGFFYDFESEAYLVISLLTREAEFAEGVRRLLQRCDAGV